MIDYESPVYVSIVLYTIYALLLLAVGLTVWSVVRGMRRQGRADLAVADRRQRKVALATLGLVVVVMAIAWLLGSTSPLSVNGQPYADAFWLRTSDMLIMTPLVLIAIIGVLMIISEIVRRKHHV
ncbi:MAG: hypothetical protein K5683_12620 [Prevotella sp.]|nr:hypothetical protein [Prevotella sp.]